jgi:hypothetical protein
MAVYVVVIKGNVVAEAARYGFQAVYEKRFGISYFEVVAEDKHYARRKVRYIGEVVHIRDIAE